MSIFVTGLDLGQVSDFTAMVIVQAEGTRYDQRLVGLPLTRCDVRYIDRYDLNTKYEDISLDVGKRFSKIPKPRYLVVDETGVGRPVMEMLAYLQPYGITITGGGEPTLIAPMRARVPKRDLVSSAQVALQNKVLRISSKLKSAELLTRELLAFRAKISETGHDTYSAWREKDHDDLVLACSMAVWFSREVIAANYHREIARRADEMARREYTISVI
jgi:hypothetical protein